ncbi:MAG: NAD(P)-dependent oxidoreductase [Pseudomonadota bacterium]
MADASGALIIGGAGYFGARLAEAQSPKGDATVTYRSLPPARAAWLEGIAAKPISYDSETDDHIALDGAVSTVINLAMPSAREAGAEPEAAKARAARTVDAALRLLEDGKASRLIQFSTFHVYGPGGGPTYDEATALRPVHPYGEIHAMAEEKIMAHPCANRAVILRATNLFGAPAHADLGPQAGLIFLDLCKQAARGELSLKNDGGSYRDILSFPDASAAVETVSTHAAAGGQVMNLGAGKALSLRTIAEDIAALAPSGVTPVYGDGSDAFRAPFNVSIERLSSLGWTPQNDLSPEIKRTLAFFA